MCCTNRLGRDALTCSRPCACIHNVILCSWQKLVLSYSSLCLCVCVCVCVCVCMCVFVSLLAYMSFVFIQNLLMNFKQVYVPINCSIYEHLYLLFLSCSALWLL